MHSKRVFAGLLVIIGFVSWTYPGFNGFIFPPADVSTGDGHIVGAIFLVGGVLLWFMQTKTE